MRRCTRFRWLAVSVLTLGVGSSQGVALAKDAPVEAIEAKGDALKKLHAQNKEKATWSGPFSYVHENLQVKIATPKYDEKAGTVSGVGTVNLARLSFKDGKFGSVPVAELKCEIVVQRRREPFAKPWFEHGVESIKSASSCTKTSVTIWDFLEITDASSWEISGHGEELHSLKIVTKRAKLGHGWLTTVFESAGDVTTNIDFPSVSAAAVGFVGQVSFSTDKAASIKIGKHATTGEARGSSSTFAVTPDASKKPEFFVLNWNVNFKAKKVSFGTCYLASDTSQSQSDKCKKRAAELGIH